MDFTILFAHWRFILQALVVTVEISVLSLALALVLGVLVALGRVYGGRGLAVVLAFLVDSLRAIPALVILVWAYFVVPLLTGATVGPFTTAWLALGVHLAAYVAETMRAGLLSVRRGQTLAALALGMTPTGAALRIVLPQAFIRMLPNLASLGVFAIKDSAIASVIAAPELVRQAQILVGETYRPFEVYTGLMALYFAISYPLARAVTGLHHRLAARGAS